MKRAELKFTGHSRFSRTIRLSCLTLLFAILAGLFAGCGGTLVTTVAADTIAETTETADEEAAASETAAEDGSISYPLTEETVTFSFTSTLMGLVADYISDYNDNPYFAWMEEQTGIHIEWRLLSSSSATEQYNLIFASEDYSDLMYDMLSAYSGGASAAIADEVIVDLAPLLETYAPDYYALITDPEYEDVRKYITLDDGEIAAVWGFSDINAPLSGTTVRKDWLDELGEDIPVTYDDWTRVLTEFKTVFGAESPLFLTGTAGNGNGGIDEYVDGFGVQPEWYVVDGEVHFGAVEEEYYEYLSLLHSWYEDGLISSDFVSITDSSEGNDLVSSGQTGLLRAGGNDFKNLTLASDDEDFQLIGISKPVLEEGDTLHFGDTRTINKPVSISTTCENPELALEWLNFIYTEEGIIASNYGVEGEAFTYDENGDPQYTDLIQNNESGLTEQQARWLYCGTALPLYSIEERNFTSYSEEGLTAITETWLAGVDSTRVYFGDLTSEESEAYTAVYNDIETYLDENIASFVTGNRSLDEYDEFVETLYDMGLEEAIALKQAAYDRYQAR